MISTSPCKTGWIGPFTAKKPLILAGSAARSFSDSAGQKPAGVSACGAADDCSCVCAGGALPRSGSSASSGKGGRSSSNASPPLALGALFTSTPEASCSSTREMRASSACASSRKDGSQLFCSNRGHDSITVFNVDAGTGKMAFLNNAKLGGQFPRDFAFFPGGKFCMVGLKESWRLASFAYDRAKGTFDLVASMEGVYRPLFFTFKTK